VIRTVADLMDRSDPLRLGDRPDRAGDPTYVSGNNDKLRTQANWEPSYGLRDGLANAIEWWTSQNHRKSPTAT